MFRWLIAILTWPIKLVVAVLKWPFKRQSGRNATVIEVWDGDTVDVEFEDGETDRVRLIGVDAHETDQENERGENYEMDAEDRKKWADKAKQFATDKLYEEDVRLVFDSKTDDRGHHDRLLAYIYIGDENFNKTLLEEGYARLYDSEFSKRSEFERAERKAQKNRVGIWSDRKKSLWRRVTPLM